MGQWDPTSANYGQMWGTRGPAFRVEICGIPLKPKEGLHGAPKIPHLPKSGRCGAPGVRRFGWRFVGSHSSQKRACMGHPKSHICQRRADVGHPGCDKPLRTPKRSDAETAWPRGASHDSWRPPVCGQIAGMRTIRPSGMSTHAVSVLHFELFHGLRNLGRMLSFPRHRRLSQ